jgi:hypothetical protein
VQQALQIRNFGHLITSRAVIFVGAISLVLAYLTVQGVSAGPFLVLASTTAFSYVVFASGRFALLFAGEFRLGIIAAWPLGVAATGIALWALSAMLGVSAAVAFALWTGVVVIVEVVLWKKAPAGSPQASKEDLIGLVLCGAFTVAWCKQVVRAPIELAATGELPAWVDFYIHGGVIAQFGDPRAFGRGVLSLADFPMPFYHYASYLLPAAFAIPLDQPGLSLATSLWLPIGFLSLAAAAYCLGASLAGAAGGVAALAALFLLPDAGSYGLRNGFFSFHWNLLAVPGTAYGLASALLSAFFLGRWTDTRTRAALIASAALVAATFLYRFHIFVLLCPAWLAAVAIASPTVRRRWRLFGISGALLLIAAILAYDYLPNLPATGASWALDGGQALERFLRQVHTRQEPTAYTGLYPRVLMQYGEPIGFAFGMLLVYPAALGAFLVLFPITLWLERRALQVRGADAFPLALLVMYAALMLLAPAPSHHDATDLIHRPFTLLYAVVAIWTVALAVRWLSRRGAHGSDKVWLAGSIVSVALLPWIWSHAAEMGRPRFNWGPMYNTYTVDRNVVEAAAFIRTRSKAGDIAATSRLPATYVAVDIPTVLASLTSTPVYLARTWYHMSLGGARTKLAIGRYNALVAIDLASDQQTAFRYLREVGIRWYVATSLGTPTWDPKHAGASHTAGDVAVYEVSN